MAYFKWKGRSASGETRTGVLEAPSPQVVEVYLRRLNIKPIEIKAQKETTFRLTLKRVSEKELMLFTRQFATVLEAGLPIVKALETLSMQQKNPYFRQVLDDIKKKVEGGSALSDAMVEHSKVFGRLYIHTVRSGEASGNLDEVLKRLAVYLEKIVAIKSKVKHAMIYPSVIVFVTIVVIAILMIFIIPKFAQLFAEAGQALPLPTQVLINISNNFKYIFGIFLALVIGFVILIKYLRRSEKGRLETDRLLLKIPIFGELFHKAAVSRMARTLGSLITAGVPLLQAIAVAAETSGNKVIEKALEDVRLSVAAGQTIADPMFYTGVFPYMLIEMVRIGEMSGRLDEMLNRVADFYEEEVDRTVATISTLIEPILLVILGGVIGGILVALYLPIFQLGGVVGGGG
jgi:type IV pilus assembly protein PilC